MANSRGDVSNSPKRVAIFGGGPGGLATAWQLTATQALREAHEVTVYTMGWRCGGKGASGRGPNGRIEEHGLHILFGCYNNFFGVMRDVYDALGRPTDAPLARFEEAFHPDGFGVVTDFYHGSWRNVSIMLPRNRAIVGRSDALNRSTVYLSMLLQGMVEVALGSRALASLTSLIYPTGTRWERAPGGCEAAGQPDLIVDVALAIVRWELQLAHTAAQLLKRHAKWLVKLVDRLRARLAPLLDALSDVAFPGYMLAAGVDFLLALARGVAVDGVFLKGGYDRIDNLDFADWLISHGAREETTLSPYVRFIYDAAFSYNDGQYDQPQCSAGTTMRTLALMGFTYKGAGFYKMQAGMGDAVFAPIYEVLAARGVRFAYFHMLEDLVPADDGSHIARAVVRQQIRLASGGPFGYQPLKPYKGLPSWPNQPDWTQLNPQDLEALEVSAGEPVEASWFESYYAPEMGTSLDLVAGRDFDVLVLAAPVATHPFVCPSLLAANRRWTVAYEAVEAVTTVSLQVWLNVSLEDLGWSSPPPLLSLYVDPLNTWADMSETIKHEEWPASLSVKTAAYFCGSFPDRNKPPPRRDRGYPARRLAHARRPAMEFVETHLTYLMPKLVDPYNPPTPNWSRLVDPEDRSGPARMRAQYLRVNCEPHERCTVSLPDTNQLRIHASDTDYQNLTVAGDWTDNRLYVACMEGAFISGILAARAVTGIPFPIIGESLYDGV